MKGGQLIAFKRYYLAAANVVAVSADRVDPNLEAKLNSLVSISENTRCFERCAVRIQENALKLSRH